jgi:hypothetical protein
MYSKAKQPLFGAVNVPLAIFWDEPGNPEYENISLRAASQPAKWANSLDTAKRLWLVDKVNTSAIYGERVAVLERRGDWVLVAATGQRTRGNEWGQVGWVIADQIAHPVAYLKDQLMRPEGVVSPPKARLFKDCCLLQPLRMLSYQVRLPILAEWENAFEVSLPDSGSGFMSRCDMSRAADLCFSGKNIVAQARQFIGLRYLWAGTSAYGFDCSGFTFRLYQSQGIYIPRNSISQANEGLAVGRENLLPGDLLFFAHEGGTGAIHHVSMYEGNEMMIHSPESKSAVKETNINDSPYRQEFWGARRYTL